MLIQVDNFGCENTFRSRFHENVYNYPTHIHQFTEIAVVLDGEIEIISEGKTERARSGDIAVIPPFRTHSFNTPQHCHVWIAVFSNGFISDFMPESELYERGVGVFTSSDETINYIKARLVFNTEKDERSIRASLYTVMEEYTRKSPSTRTSGKKDVLSSVFLYMSEHFKDDVTLESLSSALGYSSSYISHALGAIPGLSFTSILSGIRIEHAKRLLLTTDLNVATIALECGFACERSFHRAFMRLVGKAPSAYKKEAKV